MSSQILSERSGVALVSPVAWYRSLHRIICLPDSSFVSFTGTDLGLLWLRSQARATLGCGVGAGGLFATAIGSRALGTGVRQLVSHALHNELVPGFGFCRA